MTSLLLTALLALSQAPTDKAAPPPLTEAQLAKLRELVRVTQTEADEIKGRLERQQRELMRLYDAYELDRPAAEKLQGEIVDLQKQMLANYHKMQVGLRETVSADRFTVLKQRLARVLGPDGRKPPETPPAKATEK